MTEIKSLKYKIVPWLIILLTISLPFLHHASSRKYNYQIALVELLIIIAAIIIYKRDFFQSIPTDSFGFKLIIAFFVSALISTLMSPKVDLATHRYISIIFWLTYLWLMVFLIREKLLSPRTTYYYRRGILSSTDQCFFDFSYGIIRYR